MSPWIYSPGLQPGQDMVFIPDEDPPAEPPHPRIMHVAIVSPADGSTLEGAWDGVTINVTVTAEMTGGGQVSRVEIQFGSDAAKSAVKAPPWGQDATPAWTASETIKAPGTVQILARAFDDEDLTREKSLTVMVRLAAKPPDPQPSPDTTPPVVSILSPTGNASFVANQGQAAIDIVGTAEDVGQGIKAVEVLIDGAPTPADKGSDGWSNWSAKGILAGTGPHTVAARAVDKTNLSTTARVNVEVTAEPLTPPAVERLLLVEKLRLSSYLGSYGVGRTVKSFSLLPGEKTKIAVKSYRRSSETAVEASSLLDSYTQETQEEFENQLTAEQSNKMGTAESNSWNVQAQVSAAWGWGSASVSGGATGSSNASREELAKNVSNAVQKHAAKASAKRDVEVKTSREMKREEGEEFASESEIQNINLSRTLNFVFRQMNQEFITVLHLVDVRIAYVRGDRDENGALTWMYREATLSQLDGLLRQVIVPERREEIRQEILRVLENVFDYEDTPHCLVEERVLTDADGQPVPNGSYLRVPRGKDFVSTYEDAATETKIKVPGVILAVTKSVMRTDGIFCDAQLGHGQALDDYSKGLQDSAVRQREVANAREQAAVDKERLAFELIEKKDSDAAKVWKELYPAPESESLALVTSGVGDNGGG